jgi:hypothetical protein
MFKRTVLAHSILCAILIPGASFGEVTATLKNETSFFTSDGRSNGAASNALDQSDSHAAGDLLKFENSARVFINGDINDTTSWHSELNLIFDTEAQGDYKAHLDYSQYDWLRELYVDTRFGDWSARIGKQQVVWGTADGIKLLDVINPTDYREFVQSTMEDSRIPIWMLNLERNVGDSSNIQFIVSQAEENKIPGMNENGDHGHPFMMQGVDSITGEVNGFQHIIPRLTGVATSFTMGAANGMFGPSPSGLVPFSGMSVGLFSGTQWSDMDPSEGIVMGPTGQVTQFTDSVTNITFQGDNGYTILNGIAQQGLMGLMGMPSDPLANHSMTNLMSEQGTGFNPNTKVRWNIKDPKSAFEYMPNASFATFNNSSGNLWMAPMFGGDTTGLHGNATSEYVRDYPDDLDLNFGTRLRSSLDNGFNFSLNYFYGYDANPSVNLSCRDSVTGEELNHLLLRPKAGMLGMMPNYGADYADVIGKNQVGKAYDGTIGVAYNKAGQYYGAFNPVTGGVNPMGDTSHSPNGIVMTFTETLERAHNIGASFDYAMDTAFAPVVLRGEFLYKKDEMQPVIDRRLLGIGYLPEALVSEEHDVFKYVIGADVTVLTNLMLSAQFIQFANLDYQDEQRTCTTQTGQTFDCSRYTADPSTLHLSNGLNQGEEFKEFYSFFMSKPFGASQEHRWNNILMMEEGGGWWNRFDVEYSFTDELIGTFEVNQYWGDQDTMFGQFEESSNLQVGVRYMFY